MVTVATWNVENLYRVGSPFGPKTESDYRAKLNLLAATISTSQAGVIGLQEVGDPAALDEVVTVLGGRWFSQVSSSPDSRGIRVAFLSKFELSSPLDLVASRASTPSLRGSGRTEPASGRRPNRT